MPNRCLARLSVAVLLIVSAWGCSAPSGDSTPAVDALDAVSEPVASVRNDAPSDAEQAPRVAQVLQVEVAALQFSAGEGLAYIDGELFSGQAVSHYPNGQLATELHYSNGMRHGSETRWFEDGSKKFVGHFVQNELVGVFEEWYQNQQRKSQEVWQQGKRHSIMEWDENGNLLRSE